jgi:transcriptional regulator with XRE-family HTH domain
MTGLRTKEELGKEIARLREASSISQAELGAVAGLDQTAMSKVESGKRGLAAGEMIAIAEYLRVDPDALLHQASATISWRTDDSEAARAAVGVLDAVINDFFAFEAVGR